MILSEEKFRSAQNGITFLCVGMLSLLIFFSSDLAAQVPVTETVPPPIIAMSKEESASLNAEKSEKDRIKLALELMELRLVAAERSRSAEKLNEMYTDLGAFQAIVLDTIRFLDSGTRNRKNLSGFKRFEIGLRRLAPMIEVIRREVPTRYEAYIQNLSKFVRKTRSRAIEPMFGENVVNDG